MVSPGSGDVHFLCPAGGCVSLFHLQKNMLTWSPTVNNVGGLGRASVLRAGETPGVLLLTLIQSAEYKIAANLWRMGHHRGGISSC